MDEMPHQRGTRKRRKMRRRCKKVLEQEAAEIDCGELESVANEEENSQQAVSENQAPVENEETRLLHEINMHKQFERLLIEQARETRKYIQKCENNLKDLTASNEADDSASFAPISALMPRINSVWLKDRLFMAFGFFMVVLMGISVKFLFKRTMLEPSV